MYSYHAAKMFIPIFALVTLFIYRSQLLKFNLKKFIPAVLVFLFFFIPAYTSTLFGDAGARGGDLLISNLSLRQLEEISDSQYLSPLTRSIPNSLVSFITRPGLFSIVLSKTTLPTSLLLFGSLKVAEKLLTQSFLVGDYYFFGNSPLFSWLFTLCLISKKRKTRTDYLLSWLGH